MTASYKWAWVAGLAIAAMAVGCDTETAGPTAGETFCKAANCDDKNACTKDTCDPKAGKCDNSMPDDGKTCDDGDKCTADDACKALKCEGKAKNCSDDDVCTLGDKCNADDGKCLPGKAKDCDDGNKCTTDTCDPVEGCKNKPNSDACDDNDACTANDKCVDKTCKGAAVTADDGDPCTTDACSASGGVTHVSNSAECDDKNPCTVGDKCANKKCVGGAAKVCDDNNLCTDDSCDATTGTCKSVNNTKACDDSSACTKDDVCDAGTCKGTALKTDDGNPCTDDDCDKKAGVTNVANAANCEDGKVCTVGDKCADKACVPGPAKYCDETDGNSCTEPQCIEGAGGCKEVKVKDNTPCNDSDKCTNDDKCGGGVCLPGTATVCSGDGNACKDWACDPKVGCTFKAAQKGKTCDDGDACTKSDTCDAGACLPGTQSTCQDGNPCTNDSCNTKTGCVYAPNSDQCDDNNACTVGDVCKSSACAAGTVTTCDDKNPCTVDQCDKVTGKCGTQAVTDGTACEDASLCTNDTVCKTGQCAGGTKVVCKDDGNPCTSDLCSDASGCKYPNQDAFCDADGSVCTPKDYCSAGKCVADSIKSCDDSNPCTDDVCDKLKDCLNTPNTTKCDDGLMCTEGDKCKDGKCSVNTPKNCSDGNTCTEDLCDSKLGCANPKSLDGSACDDGDACSTGDACAAGACKSSGSSLWYKKETSFTSAWIDDVVGVCAAGSGGMVAVGYMSTGADSWGGLITRLDANGSVVFQKYLKDNPAFSQVGDRSQLYRVASTKDGFVAVGAADPNKTAWSGHRGYVVKVSPSGSKICEKAHSGDNSAFAGVAALPNGGFVAAGEYGAVGRITEFDSGCTPGADTTISVLNPAYSSVSCKDVAAAESGGGYWVACHEFLKTGGTDAFVFRVINGQVVKYKNVGLGIKGTGYRVFSRILADAGGATAVGEWSGQNGDAYQPMFLRLDNNATGQEVLLSGPGLFRDVAMAPDGGYFAVGWAEMAGKRVGTLSRLTDKGLLQWNKTVADTYELGGIAVTTSSYLALGGKTTTPPISGEMDGVYGMADAFGNLSCPASGTCLTKKPSDCDDLNPCTFDWCEAGACKHAIGNETLTCDTNKTCQKGKCL